MKKDFLQFGKIVIVFTLIFGISNPVSGINGTDVWTEGGYMVFDAKLKIIYNHEADPLAPLNVDISGAEVTIMYDGLDSDGNMVFLSASSDDLLNFLIFGASIINSTADPETGFTSSNNPTYRFGVTEEFEDGYQSNYKENYAYIDDLTGAHSETVKYVVIGEKFDYSMKVDNKEKLVPTWNLQLEHDYSYRNFYDFQIQDNTKFSVSEGNGVLVKAYETRETSFKLPNATAYEDLVFSEFEMNAIRSEGVKLNSGGDSDSGFLTYIMPWTTLITITIFVSFYRRRKS